LDGGAWDKFSRSSAAAGSISTVASEASAAARRDGERRWKEPVCAALYLIFTLGSNRTETSHQKNQDEQTTDRISYADYQHLSRSTASAATRDLARSIRAYYRLSIARYRAKICAIQRHVHSVDAPSTMHSGSHRS